MIWSHMSVPPRRPADTQILLRASLVMETKLAQGAHVPANVVSDPELRPTWRWRGSCTRWGGWPAGHMQEGGVRAVCGWDTGFEPHMQLTDVSGDEVRG